ncbi:NAD(P)-dependent oxidoreductase [Streptomyces sp. NP-1717]|uniref:NAD(P)-dependent oxidoreductase n=1 Tax=unclassified Streptomyces TaxID=2593676 RepID=UPI001F5CA0F3|nr:NAD(P)-binding domain-containing protein [Streptomyces sp. NP-1717]MCI3223293.1 NAD(P)-dependent oxidoreductase [Streptomyces sp. NP-1717]WTA74366.1 NAD(P)-binding domain-containing protein [Streptomyces sp. NBC_00838]
MNTTPARTTPERTTPNRADLPSVAVIGLGNLGRALASAYLGHGHRTTVWNRSPEKADDLVTRGATRAATAAEAIAAADLVIVCVLDYDKAREILTPAAGALRGRTLLNLTSGTPEPARELAAWVADQGAEYLDGAVYAVPQTIGTPDAFVLYSGSPAVFATYREQLDLLGAPTFVGADPGLASLYDISLLSGMYGMFAGFFQSVAVADSARIKAADITGLLVPWLNAAAAALPGFAAEIDSGDYATETSNLDINAVGLANMLTATRAQGIGVDLLTPLQTLFETQIAEGHGAQSLARAIESLRPGR